MAYDYDHMPGELPPGTDSEHGNREAVDTVFRKYAKETLDIVGGLQAHKERMASPEPDEHKEEYLLQIIQYAISKGFEIHGHVIAGNPEDDPAIRALANYDPDRVFDHEEESLEAEP